MWTIPSDRRIFLKNILGKFKAKSKHKGRRATESPESVRKKARRGRKAHVFSLYLFCKHIFTLIQSQKFWIIHSKQMEFLFLEFIIMILRVRTALQSLPSSLTPRPGRGRASRTPPAIWTWGRPTTRRRTSRCSLSLPPKPATKDYQGMAGKEFAWKGGLVCKQADHSGAHERCTFLFVRFHFGSRNTTPPPLLDLSINRNRVETIAGVG